MTLPLCQLTAAGKIEDCCKNLHFALQAFLLLPASSGNDETCEPAGTNNTHAGFKVDRDPQHRNADLPPMTELASRVCFDGGSSCWVSGTTKIPREGTTGRKSHRTQGQNLIVNLMASEQCFLPVCRLPTGCHGVSPTAKTQEIIGTNNLNQSNSGGSGGPRGGPTAGILNASRAMIQRDHFEMTQDACVRRLCSHASPLYAWAMLLRGSQF